MPSRATLSDFAVWDGVTRIPGVILERRRAEELYESLKQQQIDPGLLQQGEQRDGRRVGSDADVGVQRPNRADSRLRDQAARARVPRDGAGGESEVGLRRCRCVPTPTTPSPRACSRSRSASPRPHAIRDFRVVSRDLPAADRPADADEHHRNLQRPQRHVHRGFQRRVLARSGTGRHARGADVSQSGAGRAQSGGCRAAPACGPEPGFFQASALVAPVNRPALAQGAPSRREPSSRCSTRPSRCSGTSSSAASRRSRRCCDRCDPPTGSICCCSTPRSSLLAPAPVAGDTAAIEQALAFVRAGRLRGGTDLQAALGAALDQSRLGIGDRYIVLLSDASATDGPIANAQNRLVVRRAPRGHSARPSARAPISSASATKRTCRCSRC